MSRPNACRHCHVENRLICTRPTCGPDTPAHRYVSTQTHSHRLRESSGQPSRYGAANLSDGGRPVTRPKAYSRVHIVSGWAHRGAGCSVPRPPPHTARLAALPELAAVRQGLPPSHRRRQRSTTSGPGRTRGATTCAVSARSSRTTRGKVGRSPRCLELASAPAPAGHSEGEDVRVAGGAARRRRGAESVGQDGVEGGIPQDRLRAVTSQRPGIEPRDQRQDRMLACTGGAA